MAFSRVLSLEHPVLDFSKSPSLTRQEFLADSDINHIVDRFLHTGVLPQPNLGRPSVDGLDSPGDFSEACDMIFEKESQEQFGNFEQLSNEVNNDGTNSNSSSNSSSSGNTGDNPVPSVESNKE